MKTAIIGYGKMGKIYDALMPATYLVDAYPVEGRVSFTSVEEFVAYAQQVDLVIVATPTFTHGYIIKKLLENNYDVLSEKPLALSAQEAKELECLAAERGCTLYQSTLERYNSLVKFFRHNIKRDDIDHIESYRYGMKPSWSYTSNPLFDLGIHDVDLWFYLTEGGVPWTVHAKYCDQTRREIVVFLKNGTRVLFDLLRKQISLPNGEMLDFACSSTNNPLLEMLYDLTYRKAAMNEQWHREIQLIEQHKEDEPLEILPTC